MLPTSDHSECQCQADCLELQPLERSLPRPVHWMSERTAWNSIVLHLAQLPLLNCGMLAGEADHSCGPFVKLLFARLRMHHNHITQAHQIPMHVPFAPSVTWLVLPIVLAWCITLFSALALILSRWSGRCARSGGRQASRHWQAHPVDGAAPAAGLALSLLASSLGRCCCAC